MFKKSGFTIVELLIVIVVIAILAAITVVAYTGINQRATTSTRASTARTLSNAIENYYTINGTYPSVDQLTCRQNDSTPGNKFITELLGTSSIEGITSNCGAIYNNHRGLQCTYFSPTNSSPYFSGYSINGSPEAAAFNYCSNKKSASYDSSLSMSTYNCYSSSGEACIGYVLVFFTGSRNTTCDSIGFKPALGLSYVCSISNVHGIYNL